MSKSLHRRSWHHVNLGGGEYLMDSKRFNELTKALASGQSRRGVAKGLAAGLVGGVFGFASRNKADARRKLTPPGTICREDADCAEPGSCFYDSRTRRYR